MATVWPATASVAVRVSPGFSGTEKPTDPEPLCDVGVLIVTKLLVVETVHAHPVPAVTAKVALPPAPDMLKLFVEIVYVHVGGVVADGEVGVLFLEQAAPATETTTTARKRRDARTLMVRG